VIFKTKQPLPFFSLKNISIKDLPISITPMTAYIMTRILHLLSTAKKVKEACRVFLFSFMKPVAFEVVTW